MWEHCRPRYKIINITDLLSCCSCVRILLLVVQGLAAVMRIAGQRAKQDDTQVRSSSGDEATAKLVDGVDEGNEAGITNRC